MAATDVPKSENGYRDAQSPTSDAAESWSSQPGHGPYESYASYLEHLYESDSSFELLFHYFTNPHSSYDETRSYALLADALPDKWRTSEPLTPETLRDTKNVSARIIVLECEGLCHLNRKLLETVAFHYDINPLYLCHLIAHQPIDEFRSLTSKVLPRNGFLGLSPSMIGVQCFDLFGVGSHEVKMYRAWANPASGLSALILQDPHSKTQTGKSSVLDGVNLFE